MLLSNYAYLYFMPFIIFRFKPKAWSNKSKLKKHHYRRRKVKLDVQHQARNGSLKSHHLGTMSSSAYHDGPRGGYLRPYMDSASWLYLDPNPQVHLASASYALPPPCRPSRHHHHHHHHRHRHEQEVQNFNYRRSVSSEPGTWRSSSNLGRTMSRRHRRVCSMDDKVDSVVGVRPDEEDFRGVGGGRTSTFRKVPWHPNLHMLKIRRA